MSSVIDLELLEHERAGRAPLPAHRKASEAARNDAAAQNTCTDASCTSLVPSVEDHWRKKGWTSDKIADGFTDLAKHEGDANLAPELMYFTEWEKLAGIQYPWIAPNPLSAPMVLGADLGVGDQSVTTTTVVGDDASVAHADAWGAARDKALILQQALEEFVEPDTQIAAWYHPSDAVGYVPIRALDPSERAGHYFGELILDKFGDCWQWVMTRINYLGWRRVPVSVLVSAGKIVPQSMRIPPTPPAMAQILDSFDPPGEKVDPA
jgi:hypothetical protein